MFHTDMTSLSVVFLGCMAVVVMHYPAASSLTCQSRRAALVRGTCAATAVLTSSLPSLAAAPSIVSRLSSDSLNIPAPSGTTQNGVANLYFPAFMAGEWTVQQTLVNASTPLGLKFVGGPNGLEQIGAETMAEVKKQMGVSVSLKLRFVPTKWGVAEDRLFNYKQRFDAFAGRSVVASVEYANVGASNRESVLAMGGTNDDPLQTTIVRFKGPAAQKTFVVSHGAESLDDSTWAGYELDRAIFALTNENTAPPLTTDSEVIWMLEKLNDKHVRGRLRIAGYLNPNSDTLYFDARQRAVSLQDYILEFSR